MVVVPYLFKEFGGKNKVIEFFVVAGENIIFVSFPPFVTLVNENDFIADFHHRIHIMGVNHRGNIKLDGDFAYQVVDYEGSYGIESGVWLITEQISGV